MKNTPKPQKEQFRPPSYLEANRLSRFFHWYLNPLFREGYKRRLEFEDVPDTLPWDKSEHLADQLEKLVDTDLEWDKELATKSPSLAFALLKMFRLPLFMFGIVLSVVECVRICQPLLVTLLLDYFQGRGVSKGMAYFYGTLLGFLGLVYIGLGTAAFHIPWCLGMRAKAAASALIYRKMMSLKMGSLSNTSSGEILNHMATDVEKFQMSVMMIHYIWIGPLQLIIVATLLYLEFGPSFLAGLGMYLVIFVIQQLSSRIFGKMKLKVAERTDKRTHLMNEIIAGMRVIKMYCWEKPYIKIIAHLRKQEIKRGVYAGIVEAENHSFSLLSAKLVTFVTVAVYVMTGNTLTPQKVFKLVAWTEVVRFGFTFAMTLQMLWGSQAYFAAQRIQKFLTSGEVCDKDGGDAKTGKLGGCENSLTPMPDRSLLADNTKLRLSGVHASWPEKRRNVLKAQTEISECGKESSSSFSLKDINLNIKQGELVACVGSVGSGKSSLLLAILDQMPITSGNISTDSDMAYVPQEAWVFSGTLRENLLFGCPMDQSRYDETISICSLKPDTELMPSGDLSLVGERGLSLSGGQKTRLNLARAVYRNADIYLLDDPLSAVDSKVGNHLFQKCIRGYLKDKTRLLVTHQLQYLKDVDRVIVLQDGMIHACGTFQELEGLVDFSHLLEQDDQQKKMTEQRIPMMCLDKLSLISNQTNKSQKEVESFGADQSDIDVIGIEDAEQIEEEERLKGTVDFSVYRRYWQAGHGWLLFTILLILAAANKFVFIFVDWWIASWSNWFINDYEKLYNVSSQEDGFVPSESYDYLYTYTGLVAGLLVFSMAEAVVHVVFTRFAAKKLHNAMFSIVMRAPLEFFERNPVGRVLNRFSRDMVFIDELLPQHAFFVLINLMLALATVVFVSIVNPWVLLFTLPVVIAVIFLRNYGMRTTRDVKRMEALNRSPVFSHLTASLQGMSVIRAYKMEDAMTKHFDQLQDKHTASWFLFICAYRWLGVRFDVLTGIYLCCVVYAGLLLAERESVNGTLIGFSLMYIFSLLGIMQYVIRLTAELESYMTSVERILQYTKLDQEAPPHCEIPLPPNWPTNGDISFEHVTATYNENSCPALNDVCVSVKSGEKIGVVGRTGAGKSTFMMAFMRLVEPKGSIWIDGIDITTIGLHDLRKNISIIPQDPVMFTGTLRVNLDPFSEYEDEELWQVLEEVQLKEKVDLLQGQLYGGVTEGGSNFSVGQKQLVCLARAILRRNKIVLIDEATANVDQATDGLIQKMLRTKFNECTVITIAHRLNTIIDSDKVLMLERGEVKQFDHPYILLQDKNGGLYDMVRQTGRSYSEDLLMAAKTKYDNDLAAGFRK